MTILLLLSMLGPPASASDCSETATLRVDAAHELLLDAREAPAIDKAALLERARILLDRTLDEDPTCKSARALKAHADGLVTDVQALSTAAAREEVLARAEESLELLESEGVADPLTLETLRFQLAALGEVMVGDDRVEDLAARAAELGGER